MPDPASLRDSTQIVLSHESFADHREPVETEFAVTVVSTGGDCRIIGSPVEIKAVSDFLTRRGVALP